MSKILNISVKMFSSDSSSQNSISSLDLDSTTNNETPLNHLNNCISLSDQDSYVSDDDSIPSLYTTIDLDSSISTADPDQNTSISDEAPSFHLPQSRCSSPYFQDISQVSLSEYIDESNQNAVDMSIEILFEANHNINDSFDMTQPHFIVPQSEFEATKKRFMNAIENGKINNWNNNTASVDPQPSPSPKTSNGETLNIKSSSDPTLPIISMSKTSENSKISILNRTISRGRPQKNVVLKIRKLRQAEIDYWHDRKETTESDEENHKLWMRCASDKEKKNLLKIPEASRYLIMYLYRPLFLYKLHPQIFCNPVKNIDLYDLYNKL